MFLRAARLDVSPEKLNSYVSELAVVRALAQTPLEFKRPITVITGENGVGKSTLMEALAVGMRLNPEGGSRNANFQSITDSVSELHHFMVLTRSKNPRDAFFLRGESFYNLASYYEQLGSAPPGQPQMNDLLKMSHGQSLMALLERRFHTEGLFILDEPEAGLSMLRQLEFLGQLFHLARQGAQIIMATHSPVLLAIPGADIIEITSDGLSRRDFDEVEAIRAAREFVSDPRGVATYLTTEEP